MASRRGAAGNGAVPTPGVMDTGRVLATEKNHALRRRVVGHRGAPPGCRPNGRNGLRPDEGRCHCGTGGAWAPTCTRTRAPKIAARPRSRNTVRVFAPCHRRPLITASILQGVGRCFPRSRPHHRGSKRPDRNAVAFAVGGRLAQTPPSTNETHFAETMLRPGCRARAHHRTAGVAVAGAADGEAITRGTEGPRSCAGCPSLRTGHVALESR